MSELVSTNPNFDGTYLDLSLLHILEPGNLGKTWGWSYRLLPGGTLRGGVDISGTPIPTDPDGWVQWPRISQPFGTEVSVLDAIPLDFR